MALNPNPAPNLAEGDRIGFFGKLPSHGDFVSTGLGGGLQAAMDGWLQAGLLAAQQQWGRDWEKLFQDMPAWRFVIASGLWGPATIAGVLMPSRDRVGRSFPLVIAAQLYRPVRDPRQLHRDEAWFTAAEALAETSGKRDFDIGIFTASLRRMRLPQAANPAPRELGQAGAGGSPAPTALWWRIDPETLQTQAFRSPEAPDPAAFLRLMRQPDAAKPPSPSPSPSPCPSPSPASIPVPASLVQASPVQIMPQHRPLDLDGSHSTHPGTRLSINADALLLSENPRLYAVADGVGDASDAAEAARIAVHALGEVTPQETLEALVQDIKGKLGRAQSLIQSRQISGDRPPPSASLVSLAILERRFAIVWAGDARCYLLRHGMMRCLTRDHVEIGLRRTLSRGIGAKRQLVPEVILGEIAPGDRYLLCSWPLSQVLPERSIAETLLSAPVPAAAESLVQDGLIANCRENLSAVVVGIHPDD